MKKIQSFSFFCLFVGLFVYLFCFVLPEKGYHEGLAHANKNETAVAVYGFMCMLLDYRHNTAELGL